MSFVATAGTWSGTASFKLLPDDDAVVNQSTATTELTAHGTTLTLNYTWLHPDDGQQSGTLFIGLPPESGDASGAWSDSWHNRYQVTALRGVVKEGVYQIGTQFDDWLLTIRLLCSGGVMGMQMFHTAPPTATGLTPGPYEVMRGHWNIDAK